MKVSSTSSASGAGKSAGPKGAAGGFRIDAGPGEVTARPAVGGVGAAGGVSGVGALMALQGIEGGPEARSRALRKGRRLLDALDRLQLALLGDGPTKGHLGLLKRAIAEHRDASGDPELDETLNWAEVRAAVEAAKLERAIEAA
ncbi:MAG: flagellar assembly regulator FliX [Alphaproteobacteria bacterium]|nr:flagellar assembly regulator FliX [Alphaproteobacteria bacterium]